MKLASLAVESLDAECLIEAIGRVRRLSEEEQYFTKSTADTFYPAALVPLARLGCDRHVQIEKAQVGPEICPAASPVASLPDPRIATPPGIPPGHGVFSTHTQFSRSRPLGEPMPDRDGPRKKPRSK